MEGIIEYALPNGNVLTLNENVGHQIANCLLTAKPECEWLPLPNLMYDCNTASDVHLCRDLFEAIVVTGGSSMIGRVDACITRKLSLPTPQVYKQTFLAFPNATERLCGPRIW